MNQGFATKGHLEKVVAKLYGSLFRQMYELHADVSMVDFKTLAELQGADEAQGLDTLKITKSNPDIR